MTASRFFALASPTFTSYDAVMYFTDEQPFLDAVFDRYADDRPRLVYADFLDDSGAPDRAELIRVQLALARLGEDDPRRPALRDRQVAVRATTRNAWTAHLAGLVETVDFRRGVPDSVSVDANTFLERGDELFSRLHIRRLSLRDAAPVMVKVAASPLLARVHELDLCNCSLGNRGLEPLVRSPHLKNLESLDLGFNELDDAGVHILARSSNFASLTALAINDNDLIGDAGIMSLAGSPFFAGLTTLDLSGNDVGDAGRTAVVASKSFTRVRVLRVSGNRIGDAGIAAFSRSALFSRATKTEPELVLRANTIGHAGAAVLALSPALAACTTLDLSHNYLGDSGLAALLDSPHLGRLKSLRLARNQITDAGATAARKAFDRVFAHVRHLDLSGNRLTRVGMGVMAAVRGDRAVHIDVTGNVQSATAGDAPVAVSDVLPGVLDGVAEAALLKRRIAHPRHLTNGD